VLAAMVPPAWVERSGAEAFAERDAAVWPTLTE
jgi:hypothetical protein